MKSTLYKYNDAPPRTRIAKMRKGAGFLMVAVITAIMVALTSLGVTKVNQAAFGGYNSSRIMLQAQQYAEAEAAVVKATAYSDLTARSKADIQNSNGYKSEITLSAESDYSTNVKQRIASVKIYKGNEATPRYSLDVLKTSADVQPSSSGVPIGTIIAWPSTSTPTEGGTWLLCNGGTFSSSIYAKLYSVLGSTTLPSLNGRFLEGTTGTPRTTKEAGLPDHSHNITVTFRYGKSANRSNSQAAWDMGDCFVSTQSSVTSTNASASNGIYGRSSTVQPASYLVRYYIKAL